MSKTFFDDDRSVAITLAVCAGMFFGYWQQDLFAGVFVFWLLCTLAVIKTL